MGRTRLFGYRFPTRDFRRTVDCSTVSTRHRWDGNCPTPQDVALLDSRKSITFSESLKVPVIGVVENMSGYTIQGKASPNSEVEIYGPSGKKHGITTDGEGSFSVTLDIFKQGGGKATAEEFGVPFLGELPFDPGFVRGGDDGVHRMS